MKQSNSLRDIHVPDAASNDIAAMAVESGAKRSVVPIGKQKHRSIITPALIGEYLGAIYRQDSKSTASYSNPPCLFSFRTNLQVRVCELRDPERNEI